MTSLSAFQPGKEARDYLKSEHLENIHKANDRF